MAGVLADAERRLAVPSYKQRAELWSDKLAGEIVDKGAQCMVCTGAAGDREQPDHTSMDMHNLEECWNTTGYLRVSQRPGDRAWTRRLAPCNLVCRSILSKRNVILEKSVTHGSHRGYVTQCYDATFLEAVSRCELRQPGASWANCACLSFYG